MKIDKIVSIDDEKQLVYVTISHGDDKYKYDMNTPVLEGDALQDYCDSEEKRHLNNILYQVYDRSIRFEKEDKWDEWIAAGRKIPEVKYKDGDDIPKGKKAGDVKEPEKVIKKKAWVDSEPPVDTAALIAELQEKVKALES